MLRQLWPEPTMSSVEHSISAIINCRIAVLAQVRLTSQLATYYSEPTPQQQDETLNHSSWDFKVPVLNWPQTQP